MANNKTHFDLVEVISQVVIPDTLFFDQTLELFLDSGKNLVRGGVYDIQIYRINTPVTIQTSLDFLRSIDRVALCGPVGLALMLAFVNKKTRYEFGRYYSLDEEDNLRVSQKEKLSDHLQKSKFVSVELLIYPPDQHEKEFQLVPFSKDNELLPGEKLVCFVKK